MKRKRLDTGGTSAAQSIKDGALEPILCSQEAGKEYPFWSKDDIQSQWVALKSKYVSYASYADQTIQDILTPEQFESAKKLNAHFLGSSIIINEGNDNFSLRSLSASVQVAPVFGLLPFDVNADGNLDLISGGNLYGTRIKLGRYDASKGEVLLGDGKGEFAPISYQHSGFRVNGEVRDIIPLNVGGEWQIVFAKNNAPIEVYKSAITE